MPRYKVEWYDTTTYEIVIYAANAEEAKKMVMRRPEDYIEYAEITGGDYGGVLNVEYVGE